MTKISLFRVGRGLAPAVKMIVFLLPMLRHGFAVPPPLPKEANVNSKLTAMGSLEKELSVGLRIDFAV